MSARNLSPRTAEGYKSALEALQRHTGDIELSTITQDHITDLMMHLLNGHHKVTRRPLSPATAEHRYRKLKAFFNWCKTRAWIEQNPMQHLPAPKIPEETVPILSRQELKKLVKTCNGHTLRDKRDRALLRILIDTGLRRQELATITLADLDITNRRIRVMGKGKKARYIPIGLKAIDALNRYLAARAKHPASHHPQVWIGHRGPLRPNGIYQVIKARADKAGIEGVFVHRFRHTWAHRWLMAGGAEIDAMTIAGWSSNRMLKRYGQSAAQERAQQAHKRIAPGDSI